MSREPFRKRMVTRWFKQIENDQLKTSARKHEIQAFNIKQQQQ